MTHTVLLTPSAAVIFQCTLQYSNWSCLSGRAPASKTRLMCCPVHPGHHAQSTTPGIPDHVFLGMLQTAGQNSSAV